MDWRCMTNPVGKKKKKRKIFLFLYTAHIFPWFYLSKPSKYLLHWGQFFYIQAGENIFHFSTETTLHFRIKLLIFNQMNTVLLYACFYWFWVRGGWEEVRGVTRMDFEHSKNDTHPPHIRANVTVTWTKCATAVSYLKSINWSQSDSLKGMCHEIFDLYYVSWFGSIRFPYKRTPTLLEKQSKFPQ